MSGNGLRFIVKLLNYIVRLIKFEKYVLGVFTKIYYRFCSPVLLVLGSIYKTSVAALCVTDGVNAFPGVGPDESNRHTRSRRCFI